MSEKEPSKGNERSISVACRTPLEQLADLVTRTCLVDDVSSYTLTAESLCKEGEWPNPGLLDRALKIIRDQTDKPINYDPRGVAGHEEMAVSRLAELMSIHEVNSLMVSPLNNYAWIGHRWADILKVEEVTPIFNCQMDGGGQAGPLYWHMLGEAARAGVTQYGVRAQNKDWFDKCLPYLEDKLDQGALTVYLRRLVDRNGEFEQGVPLKGRIVAVIGERICRAADIEKETIDLAEQFARSA